MSLADVVLGWFNLDVVKRYYLHGELYGLIGTRLINDVLYLSCMAKGKFTKSMIKDIIAHGKENVVCLIVDTKSEQEVLARLLKKWTLYTEYVDEHLYVYCTSIEE